MPGWELEAGPSGSTEPMEISMCYKSGSPQIRLLNPDRHAARCPSCPSRDQGHATCLWVPTGASPSPSLPRSTMTCWSLWTPALGNVVSSWLFSLSPVGIHLPWVPFLYAAALDFQSAWRMALWWRWVNRWFSVGATCEHRAKISRELWSQAAQALSGTISRTCLCAPLALGGQPEHVKGLKESMFGLARIVLKQWNFTRSRDSSCFFTDPSFNFSETNMVWRSDFHFVPSRGAFDWPLIPREAPGYVCASGVFLGGVGKSCAPGVGRRKVADKGHPPWSLGSGLSVGHLVSVHAAFLVPRSSQASLLLNLTSEQMSGAKTRQRRERDRGWDMQTTSRRAKLVSDQRRQTQRNLSP